MKRFRFKFEAVEKVRKNKHDEALRAMANAQRALAFERDRKSSLVSDLNQALIRREKMADVPVSVIALQIEENFIQGTKQRIIQVDQAILRAQRTLDKTLRNYLHARRQMRIIETLREKAYATYQRDYIKFEQKVQNDLYIMRARIFKDAASEEVA